MKKTLSVVLAVLLLALTAVPAFAAGSYTVTFEAPTGNLKDYGISDAPYFFVQSKDGKMEFVEDPNGKYYLASDGYYYTADRIAFDSSDPTPRKTYSPKRYEGQVSVDEGKTLSFKVLTNEVYNAATVSVYVNGEALAPDSVGEYKVYVDRNLTVKVNEDTILRNHFSVKLVSGEGYSVKTLKGESARLALYGEDFKFRVKIGSGYSDADLKVVLLRGGNDLADYIGDDLDFARAFIDPNAEILYSDGIDSEGCRTYTIKNVTGDCKVIVSGVRSEQKQNILTYLKRLLKMILDIFKIDSSFLGLVDMVAYYDVNIDDSALEGVDADYILLSGIFDEFRMNYFTVMNGESVTIRLTTKNKDLTNSLGVKWKVDGRDEVTEYSTNWVASYDTSTGYVYYSATFVVDSINAPTNITIVNG